MMRGEKPNPYMNVQQTTLPDWGWAMPNYSFELPMSLEDITKIDINPSEMMADVGG